MTYTKGEWKVSKPKGDDSIIAIHPPHFYFHGKVDKNTEANARLISASPDLLEACKSLNAWVGVCLGCEYDDDPIADMVHKAINKAEGK